MAMTNGMNYNTPGFNPYTQNFYPTYPQIQPMQTYGTPSNPPANRNVFGRVVNSETDITPNEVPMDGSVSLFPMADYSKIFAKQWNPDGTIKTTVFVIDAQPDSATQSQYFEDEMRDRLDHLESLITRQNKYRKPYHKNGTSQNKDGDTDARS